jgi:ribosomal protein S27AE
MITEKTTKESIIAYANLNKWVVNEKKAYCPTCAKNMLLAENN